MSRNTGRAGPRGNRDLIGSIPALAGNTGVVSFALALASGSSPHGRGTLEERIRLCVGIRFIPARARDTHDTGNRHDAIPVYPRTCGEYFNRTYRTYYLSRYARLLRNAQGLSSAGVAAPGTPPPREDSPSRLDGTGISGPQLTFGVGCGVDSCCMMRQNIAHEATVLHITRRRYVRG